MSKQSEGYEKMVLAVTFNVTDNTYTVGTCRGSSVAEMAFATMVVIKTLMRDGHIKNAQEFLNKVNNYLNDPQFEEVQSNE